MLFKGNQPPKRHQVQIRSVTGQRTVPARYVRLDDVRLALVDGDAGTLTVQAEGGSHLQVGESSLGTEVARHTELTVSLAGLPTRTRERILRKAKDARGGTVSLLLDAKRGRLR